MVREDKIAISVIATIFFVLIFGVMKTVKWMGTTVFGLFEAGSQGISYTSAFLMAICLSFVLIIIFAIISGGGELLGELPFVIIGFFTLIVFFTLSIAFIF